jgi:hypothetical protein
MRKRKSKKPYESTESPGDLKGKTVTGTYVGGRI